MTDFADLKIRIDALEAKAAQGDLDGLTEAGGRSEKSLLSMSNAAKVLGSALAAISVGAIVSDIIRTNAEFQSLSAMLKVATGSVEAASAAMADLTKFAAETPYGLAQSVEAFVKLKNLGLTPGIEAMRSYGNTAASMGKDLMQMVEAVADAATGEFERLKEFGIKASVEGEKVAFTFQGVTTTVINSAAEVEKYLQNIGNTQFAGSMAEQLNTLNGQWAGLQDNLDALYIAIGNLGANSALTQMLTLASETIVFLTENLDTLVDLLVIGGAALVTYTTYTAAAATTALSGSFGIWIGTITTAYTQLGLLAAAEIAATSAGVGLMAGINALTAAMLANPAIWLAGAFAGLTAAVIYFYNEARNAQAALDGLTASGKTTSAMLADIEEKARNSGINVGTLGGAANETNPYMRALAEAYGVAASQADRLANSAKAAAIAVAQQSISELKAKQVALGSATQQGVRDGNIFSGIKYTVQGLMGEAGLGPTYGERNSGIKDVQRQIDDLTRYIEIAKKMNDAAFEPKAVKAYSAAVGDATKATKAHAAQMSESERAAKAAAQAWMNILANWRVDAVTDVAAQVAASEKEGAERLKRQTDDAIEARRLAREQDKQAEIKAAQDLADQFASTAHAANDAADSMASAFGRVGGAIGDLTAILAEYGAKQEAIKAAVVAKTMDEAEAQRELANVQLDSMGQALGAAKGLFKEHSAGYKAMAAAEKAFALVQLANTAVNIAAGAAKMFATLGPFGFPAVAAMVAVMAGLGAAVSGGGGGGYRAPTAEEVQAGQGTGTVLGDGEAKSGSLSGALELMLKNTNKDLEYSSQMVRSLRAIEGNIGNLSGLLARQLGMSSGGAFDQSGLGLGKSTSVPLIGNLLMPFRGLLNDIPIIGDLLGGIAKALFGTKKTVTLLDQGISFASQTVEDIINGGAIGQIYQDVQTQTKKKFLGITTSNKTKVTTNYSELDGDMERQVALIIGSMRAGIIDAAGVLGIEGAAAVLDAFKVDLGKISLKDLTGEEIREQLEAVFSALGDDMAAAVLPGLTAFQQVGEGVFETLARLAKNYATIDTALASIGKTFGAVGLASVEARENLIDLFGGLDAFTEQTQFFRETFLSEAEQMAPIITAVTAEMARLGQAGITTNDQFKSLVLGLDLSSSSGSEMYASLMAVAPAFAKVTEYLASLNVALDENGNTAEQAAAILEERTRLETQLWQLQGNTVALNERARAAINPLNHDIYDMIAALEAWNAAVEESKNRFNQQSTLDVDILRLQAELTGDTAKSELALRLEREAQLRAADPFLRAQLLIKFGFEDQITVMNAAADAAAKLKEEQEALAAKQKAAADELGGLNKQWLELIGDTETLQQMTLDGLLSDEARALQQKIWDYTDAQAEAAKATEDAQKAQEAYAQSLAAARDTLSQAYERESSALQGTIDKFRGFAETIADFRKGLFNSDNPAIAFAQTRGQFQSTARMASLGSEKALGAFTGDAQAYLEAAKNNAGSLAEYQSIIAEVARAANLAERGASGVASEAQRQLDLMTEQVAQFIDLNENVVTVADAITALTQIQQVETTPAITDALSTGLSQVTEAVNTQTSQTTSANSDLKAELVLLRNEMAAVNQKLRNVTPLGNAISVCGTPDGDPVRTLEVTP